MPRGKTIMILGAGAFQVAATRKAVALGYHVITVDYLPDNVAHNFSNEYVNASTMDSDAVVAAAKTHKIDGIFTMASDVALPTVARVVEELGLPGPGKNLVDILTQKNRFRPFQAAQELDGPAFIEVRDFNQAIADWPGGPAIVKPAVSSGSRGVAKLDEVKLDSRPLFESAREFSYTDRVCLEEYIDGQDVSVEGFVLNGVIQHAFITEKHVQGFAVVGHELPCKLGSTCQQQIIDQVQSIVTATGYESGPFDADFRIGEKRIVLLEMTPRLGGNGVPLLIEAAYGVSLIELSIRHAMGDLLADKNALKEQDAIPHADILLHSVRSGTVSSVATEQMFCSRLPEVTDLCINLTPGETVERFTHGGHVFGYCIVNMTDDIEFDIMVGRVLDALNIML